jgi:hypothetical protein
MFKGFFRRDEGEFKVPEVPEIDVEIPCQDFGIGIADREQIEAIAEAGIDLTDESAVRELAYFKWQEAGQPETHSDKFWFAAKEELAR